MLKIFVRFTFLVVIWCWLSDAAYAQLRVVTYTTTGGPRAGLGTVLEAIGEQLVVGVASPIDVLALQVQSAPAKSQAIVDLLNGIHGECLYDGATLHGQTSSDGPARSGL